MSYARFAKDSNVYVFMCISGALECCGCALGDETRFDSTDAMLDHLGRHRAAGHDVPQRAIERLVADREENDAFIAAGGEPRP